MIKTEYEKEKMYMIAVIVIVVTTLMGLEWPYSDLSISQYIIPTLHSVSESGSSKFSISGLPLLIGYVWSGSLVVRSEKFGNNKTLIFVVLLFFVVPLLASVGEKFESLFYEFQSGVESVEIEDSSIYFWEDDHQVVVNVDVQFKGHKDIQDIDLEIILPESARKLLGKTSLELEKKVYLYDSNEFRLQESIEIPIGQSASDIKKALSSVWREKYTIVLIHDGERVEWVRDDEN